MPTKESIQNIFPSDASIPKEHAWSEPWHQTEYFVKGEILHWNGPRQEVLSPVCTTGSDGTKRKLLGSYPLLTEKESLAALDAAVGAFDHGRGFWPTLSVEKRIRCMDQFVQRMIEQRRAVIALLMWEIGKSQQDAAKEFDRTVEYIRDTVDALKELDRASSRFQIKDGIAAQIRRAPLGVVLCMGPFNYPLNETFTTLIPALIMGNTVIFKPPKLGVLLHRPLLEAFRDCFPPGAVNTVYGDGQKTIAPLMASGKIDVLAFIGSSRVADLLKKQHPNPHRLRGVLGLGAKNPAVVLADADLDGTIREAVTGCLSFNGQRCTALKIFFVHAAIAETFVARLSEAIAQLPIGMPWDPKVAITPLAEAEKPAYLTDLVEDAARHGARVANPLGGAVHHSFFYPAVLFPVSEHMRAYHEEQFGPVIPVVPFEDIKTPIDYIVASPYGQQVSLFGNDPETLARLIDPLVNQVCRVNLNCQCQRGPDTFPFTGRKDSAEGTLSVSDALRVFSIRTLVASKQVESNTRILKDIMEHNRSAFLSTDFLF